MPPVTSAPSGSSRTRKASSATHTIRSETKRMAGAMDPFTTSLVSDRSVLARSAECRARYHS